MRLIDADAFIQMMEEKCDPKSTLDPWVLSVCRGGVKMMPTAQPGWTYIEEALPKTIINKHTHDFQEYNCLCDFGEYGFDVRTYKFGNGHFWNGGGIVDKYVTAWQPLPEIPDALKQKPWEGGRNA